MEGEGQSCKRVGWQQLMLIVVCCVVVICVVTRVLFYLFCRAEHPTHGDILTCFNARTNAKLLPPSPADTPPCTVEVSAAVKMGGVQLGFAFIFHFVGQKYAFFVH